MITIGIVGYGNLGRGVELALKKQKDMNLFGVFSKRDPQTVETQGAKVYHYDELITFKNDIDVLILCGSSERDLRTQSPQLSENFNIVDSFDMHAIILDHVDKVHEVAHRHEHTALVSVGWDPGIFSTQKTIMDAILPDGETQTFWGSGISQGHSDVASRVEGVIMARSYTIPNEENIAHFKSFEDFDASLNHHKICYVVKEDQYDEETIESAILDIPHYFKNTSAEIRFISMETMNEEHQAWPQKGRIIHRAHTSEAIKHTVEYTVTLKSNPEFTASNLVAFARANYKMNQRQCYGAFTALDVSASDLSSKTRETLIKEML